MAIRKKRPPVKAVPAKVVATKQPILTRASKPTPAVVSPQRRAALKLGSSLSIREVAACSRELHRALESGVEEIDASALEVIDTAGLQLLLVAAAAAQDKGRRLRLSGTQRLLGGVADALGLSAYLAVAMEVSS